MKRSTAHVAVAGWTHRLAVAMAALEAAEAGAKAAGLNPNALKAAILLVRADPEIVAEEQDALGRTLMTLKVPGLEVETAELVERVIDERPRARKQRFYRQGYIDGVMGRAGPDLSNQQDADWWALGAEAWTDDLKKFSRKN